MKKYLVILFMILLPIAGCRKIEIFRDDRVSPHDFLSDKKYRSLVVEIDYVSGFEPSGDAADKLQQFLEQRLNKPAGISFVYHSIASPGKTSYTIDDIKKTEKDHRMENVHGETVTAYFLFIDGNYADDGQNSKALGLTYGNSSVVIFEKTLHDFSGHFGQPEEYVLEATVMDHEFGHLLGLVNDGTKMVVNHQDVSNGYHCDNSACLMYYAVETSDVLANMVGSNIPALDDNCIKDLQANGGK
ncbi:MAG: peptidase [Bacteroidetes bacterium]|nr:peptidase [Bacteroidota bacterium]